MSVQGYVLGGSRGANVGLLIDELFGIGGIFLVYGMLSCSFPSGG